MRYSVQQAYENACLFSFTVLIVYFEAICQKIRKFRLVRVGEVGVVGEDGKVIRKPKQFRGWNWGL